MNKRTYGILFEAQFNEEHPSEELAKHLRVFLETLGFYDVELIRISVD